MHEGCILKFVLRASQLSQNETEIIQRNRCHRVDIPSIVKSGQCCRESLFAFRNAYILAKIDLTQCISSLFQCIITLLCHNQTRHVHNNAVRHHPNDPYLSFSKQTTSALCGHAHSGSFVPVARYVEAGVGQVIPDDVIQLTHHSRMPTAITFHIRTTARMRCQLKRKRESDLFLLHCHFLQNG
jgi:hypothetical protein